MQYAFQYIGSEIKIPYEIRQQHEKEGIRGFKTIEFCAEKVGYYKQDNFSINDIFTILNQYCTKYNLFIANVAQSMNIYQVKVDKTDLPLICKLLPYGISTVLTLLLETCGHDVGSFTQNYVAENLKLAEQYYYYVYNKLVRKNYDTLWKKYDGVNRRIIEVTYNILRNIAYPCEYNAEQNYVIPYKKLYNCITDINQAIEETLDSYYIEDTKLLVSKEWIERVQAERPVRAKAYKSYCNRKQREFERERERDRQEIEEWKAYREAQMRAYDRACDRFGVPVPFATINIM